jgi:hypothetical protein
MEAVHHNLHDLCGLWFHSHHLETIVFRLMKSDCSEVSRHSTKEWQEQKDLGKSQKDGFSGWWWWQEQQETD